MDRLKSRWVLWRPLCYGAALLLGIGSGLSSNPFLQGVATVIADVFVRIFKCMSLPLIFLSLVNALGQQGTLGAGKLPWRRTLFYTFSTTAIAAAVSCLLYLIIQPANIGGTVNQLSGGEATSDAGYLSHISDLIPNSIFSPFLEHQVVGVMLLAVLFGTALRSVAQEKSGASLLLFFNGLHTLFLTITRWVVAILPVGLFGFVTTAVMQLQQGGEIRHLASYLAVVVCANLIQGIVILPLWLKWNQISPWGTMRAMFPAISLAFFSKSSTTTLPLTIEMAEQRLKIAPQISRFVLPICTTINMNGCAAFIFTTAIYLMQNHGMEISGATLASWIIISTLAAIGNAGVPMGCFLLSSSLVATMGIPLTILGMILPFYTLIDMVETALNVWSDSCVAVVVNKKSAKINSSYLSVPP